MYEKWHDTWLEEISFLIRCWFGRWLRKAQHPVKYLTRRWLNRQVTKLIDIEVKKTLVPISKHDIIASGCIGSIAIFQVTEWKTLDEEIAHLRKKRVALKAGTFFNDEEGRTL